MFHCILSYNEFQCILTHIKHIKVYTGIFSIYYTYTLQDSFRPEEVPNSSFQTTSKHVMEAMLPGIEIYEESMHEGDWK